MSTTTRSGGLGADDGTYRVCNGERHGVGGEIDTGGDDEVEGGDVEDKDGVDGLTDIDFNRVTSAADGPDPSEHEGSNMDMDLRGANGDGCAVDGVEKGIGAGCVCERGRTVALKLSLSV